MDATAALNPTPGRAMMSKSIELGLPGAAALLLAVLLAGCTGAPSPTTQPTAVPTPAATAGPGATPEPTPEPETTELGAAGFLQQCEQRTELAMTSRISATQASTQRWGMALGRWHCAGKPFVLTLPRRRGKGLDADEETGASLSCLRPESSRRSTPGAAEPVDRDD